MKKLSEYVRLGAIVADGGWGTQLQKMGLTAGACPEEWNILFREKVQSIPAAYIAAGARMVKTNSFGANRFRLGHNGLDDKAFLLAKLAAEISRQAAGEQAYVAGSIGPSGKMLMMEEVTEEELTAAFTETVRGLIEGGVDVLLVETFSDLDEMDCALRACRSVPGTEVICSAVFQKTGDDDFRTMMGATVEAFYKRALAGGAAILGTNCGNGFRDMIPIIQKLRTIDADIPLLVLPNAGIPVLEAGKIIYPETPEMIREIIPQFLKAGANIIGGCCGTTPEHIGAIAEIVQSASNR